MAWYNAGWDYRVKITIDHTKVNSTLTDFPVYVDLSGLPAGFHTNCNQTDARDIRVTRSDGTTECAREVVSYTAATDTGELHFKANSISSSAATEFYIYYGNSSASDYATDATYGAENVWDSNYKAVLHLKDATTTTTTDSTVNNNNATKKASGEPDQTTSKIGEGQSFTGNDDYLIIDESSGDFDILNNITISAWVKPSSLNLGYQRIIHKNSAYTFNIMNTSSRIGYHNYSTSTWINSNINVLTKDQWSCIVLTQSSTGGVVFYVDGASQGGDASKTANMGESDVDVYIGIDEDITTHYFNGLMDEIRISNIVRSSDWIGAEYNNQSSPATFYGIGSQESGATDTHSTSLLCVRGLSSGASLTHLTIQGVLDMDVIRFLSIKGLQFTALQHPISIQGVDYVSRLSNISLQGGLLSQILSQISISGSEAFLGNVLYNISIRGTSGGLNPLIETDIRIEEGKYKRI